MSLSSISALTSLIYMDPAKKALRTVLLQRRKAVFDQYMTNPGEYYRLLENETVPGILSRTDEVKVISGFYPINSEIDCGFVLRQLLAHGFSVCLPVVVGRDVPLIFRHWDGLDSSLEPAPFHTKVPASSSPEVEPDLLLVPMLGFRSDLTRLGYGGGFYDRTLSALRERKKVVAVGIAFEGQFCEEVPRGESDQSVDCIVTEKGLWMGPQE